ncbi:MAG TPA: alpha/beta hydrolase [Tepidisphaeraceae bacterium]|jgi:acetyl esterase/lipase|nr:alpha/beta hydrolase [Tepidisphaeraceae bacterium]
MPLAARGEDRKPAPLPPGVKLFPNLEYAAVNGKSLLLDLYLPDKADLPVPVILFVHGGAWQAGDRHDRQAVPLVTKGYAVASIDYRLSEEALFPAQIHDCKAAVRWLRAHAKAYGLDPAHIGAWGTSAGGHLVALLGTTGDVKELEGDEGNLEYSSRVQAVCDWFGPTDLTKMDEQSAKSGVPSRMHHNAPDAPEAKLIGGPVADNKEKAAKANPITYVSKDDPPFLIMHGDKDPLVPLAQSELLRDALEKAGVPVKLEVIRGAGHGFGSPEISQSVQDFFDKNLKPVRPQKAQPGS